jgi:hypothetical protein
MKNSIDFIGIGCRKSATTSVFNALAMHPLIIPPLKDIRIHSKKQQYFKECHYWERDVLSCGIQTYHKKFWGDLKEGLIYGEFTPDYIIYDDSMKMIRDYNPDIKLIAIFRNPIERLWSEYRMFQRKENYALSFKKLIEKSADLQKPVISPDNSPEKWPLYTSCYGTQVEKLMRMFDPQNLFLLKMEELKDFAARINDIFNFLGVHSFPVPALHLNIHPSNTEIPFYEELMERFFLKEIELLESLTGWNCDDWKTPPETYSGESLKTEEELNEKSMIRIWGNHVELGKENPAIKDIEFSICTGVRDRNELLLQALPSWLELPATEIVIVDWSSTQKVKHALAQNNIADDRIKIIRVENEIEFAISKVWNLALLNTREDYILKIDSDIIVKPKRILRHRVNSNTFYIGARNLHGIGTFGTIWLTREMFLKSNGYNERLSGWGFEDNDLYNRLVKNGYSCNRWSKKAIKHIDHPNSKRLGKNIEINRRIARESPWTKEDTFYKPQIKYIA